VIYVHGIGEQGAFEHLETGATDLIQALRAKEPRKRITASVHTTADAPYRSRQETWRAEGLAPVTLDVKDRDTGAVTRIELREVWWADLGEPATIPNFARFLWWGCTLWARRSYTTTTLQGFKTKMFMPREREEAAPEFGQDDRAPIPASILDRVQLFFFALLFVLVLPTWVLLGLVLQALRLPTLPSARILLQYLGDVKLYGQSRRHDLWPLADIGTPPRFMIRRRFARAMIDTVLSGYDRWYVLGHSLGSVVSLNGLMEPGHSLPNYLDEARWKKCGVKKLARKLPRDHISDVDNMKPARPAWLDDADALDRRELFDKFRGLLTYGSPLDKFAVIFPATVPLNRDQYVFPEHSEWINVFEPTDPVAGPLDFYGPFANDKTPLNGKRALFPVNYVMRCWPVALWSHIKYFAFRKGKPNMLADSVQNWLIHGESFQSAFDGAGGKELGTAGDMRRRISKWLQIAGFFLVSLLLLAWIIEWKESWLGLDLSVVGWAMLLIACLALIVFLLGALAWWFGSNTQNLGKGDKAASAEPPPRRPHQSGGTPILAK
jgi:hypothetical protein